MVKKILLLLLVLVLCIPSRAEWLRGQGPYRKGEWVLQITSRSQGAIFSWASIPPIVLGVTEILLPQEDNDNVMLGPSAFATRWTSFAYEGNDPYEIETPYGKLKPRRLHLWGGNYSVGIRGGYMSYNIPLGFYVELDYSHQLWEVKMPGTDYYTQFNKSMICPEAILRFRFGDYTQSKICPLIDIGGGYNYAFKSNNKAWEVPSAKISVPASNDLNVLNNGYTGIIGAGYLVPSRHFSMVFRCRYDYYNYFNNDYTINGIKPYAGWKSKRGTIEVCVEFGL